ncbi:MAG: hypothetical protein ACYCYP_09605 [Leptospirales bacterium]
MENGKGVHFPEIVKKTGVIPLGEILVEREWQSGWKTVSHV